MKSLFPVVVLMSPLIGSFTLFFLSFLKASYAASADIRPVDIKARKSSPKSKIEAAFFVRIRLFNSL